MNSFLICICVTWPIVVCPVHVIEVFPICVITALFALLASFDCAEAYEDDHKKRSSDSPHYDGVLEVIFGGEEDERICVWKKKLYDM